MIINIVKNTIGEGLQSFEEKRNITHKRALKAMALQLLNNVVNGSPAESIVPPILTGFLRSSGSVFIGSELIAVTPGQGTPGTSFAAEPNVITVGFNTAYARRMHENNWKPGPVSRQSGNVGNKFLSKHMERDWPELLKLYESILKKDLFNGQGIK